MTENNKPVTGKELVVAKRKDLEKVLGFSGEAFKKAIPANLSLTAERLIRLALTAFVQTPALWECETQSIVRCVMEAAQLGFEVGGPLGHCYFVPRKKKATLMIGYRGFIELARRSGDVSFVRSILRYANDKFDLQEGTSPAIVHVPLLTGDRGELQGVYAVVRYRDGSYDFDYMSIAEVEKVEKRSSATGFSPWKHEDDRLEMIKKTPIRRLAKRMPLSTSTLQRAAAGDELREIGMPADIVPPPDGPVPDDVLEGEIVESEAPEQEDAGAVPDDVSEMLGKYGNKAQQIQLVEECKLLAPGPACWKLVRERIELKGGRQ